MTLWKHTLIIGEDAAQLTAEQQAFLPYEEYVVVRNGTANRLIVAPFGKTQEGRQHLSWNQNVNGLFQRGNRNGSRRERQAMTIRGNHGEQCVIDLQQSAGESGIQGFGRYRYGRLFDQSCHQAG